jgi:hypothetical protein
LLAIEEDERQRRSLDRRLRAARIGTFKAIADFDWNWPKRIDRQASRHASSSASSRKASTSSTASRVQRQRPAIYSALERGRGQMAKIAERLMLDLAIFAIGAT